MRDGAYYLSASTPYGSPDGFPPVGYVHAFDKAGKELYDELADSGTTR